jgi:YbbR domain-containing protein
MNNFGLKLLSVFFAMTLWLVVISIEDPENSRTFTLPVTVENEDYITDMGMTYEVLNSSDTIRITVTAKRSILEDMTSADFEAVADMENIDSNMEKVLIQVSSRYNSNQVNIIGQMQYMDVRIEKRVEQKYRVETQLSGEPADGYSIGSVTLSPNVLTISGPESIMEQLDYVAAVVDVSGITSDATLAVKPSYYDVDGNKIDTSKLVINVSEITASVSLNNVKQVPVNVTLSGQPADGYAYKSIRQTVDTVAITGSDSALAACSQISISGSKISISGASADVTIDVKLADYLPDGILIADGTETMRITVEIEEKVERELSFDVSQIVVDNLADGDTFEFESNKITVRALALSSIWDVYDPAYVTLAVDASGLSEGRHYVAVEVQMPQGFTVLNSPKLYVSITPEENGTDDEEPVNDGNAGENANDSENAGGNTGGNTDGNADNDGEADDITNETG